MQAPALVRQPVEPVEIRVDGSAPRVAAGDLVHLGVGQLAVGLAALPHLLFLFLIGHRFLLLLSLLPLESPEDIADRVSYVKR